MVDICRAITLSCWCSSSYQAISVRALPLSSKINPKFVLSNHLKFMPKNYCRVAESDASKAIAFISLGCNSFQNKCF